MPVTINGSTGITDADGGSVLSSADLASQAEAQAGTDNTKIMTPLRVAEAITALSRTYSQSQLFTASGTFNTPAGVTQVYAVVAGAGGGGAGWNTTAGGLGGYGGVAAGLVSVSGAMTVTVGVGGTGGVNTGSGTAGGTSSFGPLSATGGGGGSLNGVAGADGVGSGGLLSTNAGTSGFEAALSVPVNFSFLQVFGQSLRSDSTTQPATVYALSGGGKPGSSGRGATGSTSTINTGDGGTGGAVFIFW